MSRRPSAFRRWPEPQQRATDNSLRRSTIRAAAAADVTHSEEAAMKAPLLTAFALGLLLLSAATPALAGPPVVYRCLRARCLSTRVHAGHRKERMRRDLDVLQQRLEEQRIREGLRTRRHRTTSTASSACARAEAGLDRLGSSLCERRCWPRS